ncbi:MULTISPECIES: ATP-dependent nuclease [Maribacter]|uniref:ATP-binding protein n=1 Tax=Maribacter flavus TaxID=1658664 RepID=A0ABU7II11_9FLAO|nr:MULTISPECIES: ATP-binding protein [Maribacter]MDC6404934.1 ATP-binding protein [Maribacter sp. PR66]MEE1972348.1 ATP-binding protein [Maribacter flavus]
MLGAIKINTDKLSQFTTHKTEGFIFGIKRNNVFVGVNNSGKSRLLREIVNKNEGLEFFRNDINQDEFKRIRSSFISLYSNAIRYSRQLGFKIKDEFNYTEIINKISIDNSIKFLEFAIKSSNIGEEAFDLSVNHQKSHLEEVITQFRNLRDNILSQYRQFLLNKNVKTLYVPILRGLRPIQYTESNTFNNKDSFLERTKFDYFKTTAQNLSIYTGLSIYDDIRKLLLGTENQRKEIKEFEVFLGEHIFKRNVTLIPKYDEDVLHIKLGNDKQYEIYNLGDGLQTIISILFPIFLKRNEEVIVCIEEPENHLHPAWQLRLLNALKLFSKHIFFYSTHSNVFINDSSISLYSISKSGKQSFISFLELEEEKLKIIQDLGYKPSDLFQTNYVLWVEGPSDKLYLNYWISELAPDLKEDVHYSIMYYGGETYKSFLINNGELELKLIKKLNQNFGIILDSDRRNKYESHNPKKKQIEQLFLETGNFCWLMKYREIENYIPLEVFKEAIQQLYNTEINIKPGEFEDRCLVEDLNAKVQFRSTIKLPQEIFAKIQKNGNGSTKGISSRELRKHIEKALQETTKNSFKIRKVKVAEEVIGLKPKIIENELKSQLNRLIEKIKKANQIH